MIQKFLQWKKRIKARQQKLKSIFDDEEIEITKEEAPLSGGVLFYMDFKYDDKK